MVHTYGYFILKNNINKKTIISMAIMFISESIKDNDEDDNHKDKKQPISKEEL